MSGIENNSMHEEVDSLKEELENARRKLKTLQEKADLYDKEIIAELRIFDNKFDTPLEGVKYLKRAYLGLKCQVKEEEEVKNYKKVAGLPITSENPEEPPLKVVRVDKIPSSSTENPKESQANPDPNQESIFGNLKRSNPLSKTNQEQKKLNLFTPPSKFGKF